VGIRSTRSCASSTRSECFAACVCGFRSADFHFLFPCLILKFQYLTRKLQFWRYITARTCGNCGISIRQSSMSGFDRITTRTSDIHRNLPCTFSCGGISESNTFEIYSNWRSLFRLRFIFMHQWIKLGKFPWIENAMQNTAGTYVYVLQYDDI
jgi:hypothetical protein